MALSMRNICLLKTSVGFRCLENHVFRLSFNKIPIRNLRGSRLGKELNKEESKYRSLLKSLKDDSNKPVVYTSGNIPVGEVTNKSENNDGSAENVYKTLEEKITPLKNVSYTRQLEKKYNKTLALLRLFGQKLRALKVPIALGADHLPCPVDLTIPSPLVEAYRNQDVFSIGVGLDGNLKTIGFYMESATGNKKAVCMSPDELIIIKESHKEFVKDLQNYVKESSLSACIQFDDGGHWHSVQVRSNVMDELMGVIYIHPQSLTKEELLQEGEKLRDYFSLAEKPYNLKSLYLQTSSQPRGKEANLELLWGESCIREVSNGMKLQISPESYFPSNTKAMEYALDNLLKICRVRENTTVLDIFCGTGALSLMMSPHVQRCIGIDFCSSSIKDAKRNALANNRHNVEFLEGNPEYFINDILNKDYYEDLVVVINPSRVELSKAAIKCLRACKHLKKIVYITTKLKPAAENFIKLCKPCGGEKYLGKYFVPILAVPVDLYPQTNNFGLTVMFQRL